MVFIYKREQPETNHSDRKPQKENPMAFQGIKWILKITWKCSETISNFVESKMRPRKKEYEREKEI